MTRALLRFAVVGVAVLALVAAVYVSTNQDWPATEPTMTAPVTSSAPTGLQIPRIDVDVSGVMPLATDDSGEVEVPPVEHPMTLGWYSPGVMPGEDGPHIMLGHVNGGGMDGVFARLDDLAPGDEIAVPTATDEHVYKVDRVQVVDKDTFPTEDVYGNTSGPELRLITCGGTWDPVARSYEDQVIVYATEI